MLGVPGSVKSGNERKAVYIPYQDQGYVEVPPPGYPSLHHPFHCWTCLSCSSFCTFLTKRCWSLGPQRGFFTNSETGDNPGFPPPAEGSPTVKRVEGRGGLPPGLKAISAQNCQIYAQNGAERQESPVSHLGITLGYSPCNPPFLLKTVNNGKKLRDFKASPTVKRVVGPRHRAA